MNARVSLLDGFRVSVDDARAETTVGGLPHGVQRLIAHLGLSGRPARGAVAGQLWPEVPESHAHGSLRSALWRVQKAVPGLVDVSGGAVALARGVRVDVRELVDWARAVLDPGTRVERIATPAAALAGELLPGWYDDWVLLERERLRQLRMHALEVLADRLVLAGRYGEAVQAAYEAARDEPLRESAHRAIVRVHLAEGNLAEAMRAYTTFRDALARELGVPPTRQMEDLVSRWQVRVVVGGPGVPGPRPGARTTAGAPGA
ncbi:DNA-binding SARP family transcriptional activator [Geodermatophilus bullaregiensis]|uniref:AfsR/SARP family transcriptional regulator n=1 Tax=Geodermatophilus bullaregiensis TaxID=1564160 RepID=UPI0019596AAE|nr:BTAD domain-containing putative transcriptional regulator [Geodermatophilus bullaregiensis]MBM7809041.1 DNA-binding SARP family transcriptional activator [Geodermatophilus bullaregiensis]